MKKVLLVWVAILLLTGCKDKENKSNNNTNTTDNTKVEEKETVRLYQFNNVTTMADNPTKEVTDVQQLYLLDDGTYWFISGVDCREAGYGTYTEDDKNVTINELKTYACRDCYYEGLGFSMTFTKLEDNLEFSGIIFEKQNTQVDMTKVARTSTTSCNAE